MKRCFSLCRCSASIRHGSGDPSLGEEGCVRPCALVQAFFLPRADPAWLLSLFRPIFPLPQSNSLWYQAAPFIASAWLMSPSGKDSIFLANWSGTSPFSRPPSRLTSSGKSPWWHEMPFSDSCAGPCHVSIFVCIFCLPWLLTCKNQMLNKGMKAVGMPTQHFKESCFSTHSAEIW